MFAFPGKIRFMNPMPPEPDLPQFRWNTKIMATLGVSLLASLAVLPSSQAQWVADSPRVTLVQSPREFILANGWVEAHIQKSNGVLASLKYQGLEMLAGEHGDNGGYWSSVGKGGPGPLSHAQVLANPEANGGERAEIACCLTNNPHRPKTGLDADFYYTLNRGDSGIYVSARFSHPAGYPPYGVGEARYCLKLNPEVFDFLSVDADRQRLMPNGWDWDHGLTLNLKEARLMTTGVHRGEVEHKYDYSAVLADTPAYGWSSTRDHVGLWLVNPSLEYMAGGPTKAELTGHLDVNKGGLPTLLNMWVGSHYGGSVLSIAQTQAWTKVVGPFLLYCNQGANSRGLWTNALEKAAKEQGCWPYEWAAGPDYPPESSRATLSGRLVVQDPFDPGLLVSNAWIGVTEPDYVVKRPHSDRYAMPETVDWQRDARAYQFWARVRHDGSFVILHIRPGNYTLHAIADGVLGELAQTNLAFQQGEQRHLGSVLWVPHRFGPTLWQIGVPDRTAREFLHGDHYWQWGLYYQYPTEFPKDVDFVVGRSDWHRDWNYVQPPRIDTRHLPLDFADTIAMDGQGRAGWFHWPRTPKIRPTTWSIEFNLPKPPPGGTELRLAFCGTHQGCKVFVKVNGHDVGNTGTLPATSAMQRDGIRAYWVERDLAIPSSILSAGANRLQLYSPVKSWSQGVMYDCLRLEAIP